MVESHHAKQRSERYRDLSKDTQLNDQLLEAGWSEQSPPDPFRLHPHQSPSPEGPQSCENSVPLTLTGSNPETQSTTAGMWARARLWAAGQPRGLHNGEPGPGRGKPRSAPEPVCSCPGWEPSARRIHLLLEGVRGMKAASAEEGATEPRSQRAEGPRGGAEWGGAPPEGPG